MQSPCEGRMDFLPGFACGDSNLERNEGILL